MLLVEEVVSMIHLALGFSKWAYRQMVQEPYFETVDSKAVDSMGAVAKDDLPLGLLHVFLPPHLSHQQ